jgi:uncharacterized protein YqeY
MSDSDQPLKTRIQDALRQGDRRRLSVIRLILAAVKQREIDDQVELDDAGVLGVLQKMTKQRRDSIDQAATPSTSTVPPSARIWPTRSATRST